jgi:excisionase family DNA binding protein
LLNATLTINSDELAKAFPENGQVLAAILKKLDAIELQLQSANSQPEPVLLTKAQAAKRLGVSDRTAYTWIKAGLIPTVTIDGRDWIRSAALDEAMRNRESGGVH